MNDPIVADSPLEQLARWAPAPDWMAAAACRGMHPDLFFPDYEPELGENLLGWASPKLA